MIQRLLALILLCCLPLCGMAAAATSNAATQSVAKPQKSIEDRYLAGQACLQQADVTCAQVELAGMAPNSPYAKLIEAQIAASLQDFDTALRLLIPLQANGSLLPQASASLHLTLAQTYENQGNALRAVEQLNLLTTQDQESVDQRIWRLFKDLPHETLLALRGESQDTLTQGWIDLALAAQAQTPASEIARWRTAYPDHPVSAAFLQQLAQVKPSAASASDPLPGIVAVLLPLGEPAYQTEAAAVQAGLMAARGSAGGEVRVYPSHGGKGEIAALYQQAIAQGAQYVVGPMTREEVTALAASGLKLVPTLSLNSPEQETLPENLMAFGLPVEAEATQVARVARAYGMQSAIIVSADTPIAKRMTLAFVQEWKTQEGTILAQKTFAPDTNLAELKADLAARPADMIFLAANADQARLVRPYLDHSIPTFATSHIYDGVAQNPQNAPLSAIHFVDMPWLLNPDHPDFDAFRAASAKLPPGEAQRWFAVGVDAWHILAAKAAGKSLLLPGLSGTLRMEGNATVRELSLAQFTSAGVALEQSR